MIGRNVIFPIVKKMHSRWKTYGNSDLLPKLTVRDLISENNIAKKTNPETNPETNPGSKEIPTFPVFTMFPRNSQLAEKSEDLVMALKATMFKQHGKESATQQHAGQSSQIT